MNILIIKTSSLGDVIHTLPAITDAASAIKDIQFDWLVEKNFSEIPALHPAVKTIIPISLRSWRKKPFNKNNLKEIIAVYRLIRQKKYDYIIDAQGLLKSAIFSLSAKGKRVSFDRESAREPWMNFIYKQTYFVPKKQHAIHRLRQLFAKILKYEYPSEIINYGLKPEQFLHQSPKEKYIVLLHGTTWLTKHWPENYWQRLARLISENNLSIRLLWGNETEYARAKRLSAVSNKIQVMEKLNLNGVASLLANSTGVVAADTGLGHLSAALGRPTVSLYGPTNPLLTGAHGPQKHHLSSNLACAPCLKRECSYQGEITVFPTCFEEITPEKVWQQLKLMINL
jgi:heptosyltransferase-1